MTEPVATNEVILTGEPDRGGADSSTHLLAVSLLAAGAYYIGSLIGFALTFPHSAVSVLWPPNAILLTALLLTPQRKWWAIVLGVFPVHVVVQLQSGVPILMNLLWFISNSGEALFGAFCVRRWVERGGDFAGLRNLAVYLGAAITAPFLGSFLDASFVSLAGWKGNTYWHTWLTRFPSNVLAALTIPPLIILWLDRGVVFLRGISRQRGVEASVLGLSLLTIGFTVFCWESVGPGAMTALIYLPLPLLLWAAVRFGQLGASTVFLLILATSICGAFSGGGPFLSQAPANNVLSLQFFLIAVFLPVMILGTVVEEKKYHAKVARGSDTVKTGKWPSMPLGLGVAAITLWIAYYFGSLIGLALLYPGSHFSVIWPANAFLLATLLLYPPRHWPLFLLVGAMAYVAAQGQTGTPASRLALYFLYDCSVVVVTALTVRQFGAHKYDLGNVGRTVVVVAQISAATALMAWIWPLIHIFLGPDSHRIWLEWRHTFLSNLLPFLILTPGIVFGSTRSADLLKRASLQHWLEMSILLAGILASGIGVFGLKSRALGNFPALLYVPLPFLLWAAVRLGPAGLSLSFLVFALMAILNALAGHGPFVTQLPAENIFWLQIFLLVLFLPLLLLASLFEERWEKLQLLSETEDRFRNIADAAPIMIWVSGTDKLCTFFSKGWLDFTGRTIEQELGNGWSEGVHPKDFDHCLWTYMEAFDRRDEFSMEYRLRRADGEYRWILDNGMPRFGPDGIFLGYTGSATDITERKKAESRQHIQYAITRIVAESTSMADAAPKIIAAIGESLDWQFGEMWSVHRETNRLVPAASWHLPSPELAEYLSASREFTFAPGVGLPGRVWARCEPTWVADIAADGNFPRGSLAAKAGLRSAFAFALFHRAEILGVMAFFSRELREPDPALLEMMANLGNQLGLFAERKQAEEALRQSEARLKLAMETAGIGYWELNLATGEIARSESQENIMGTTAAPLAPSRQAFYALVHPEDREALRRQVDRCIQALASYDIEYRIVRPDGKIRWVASRGHAVADGDGRASRVLGMIVDITDRKRAEEELKEALREVQRLKERLEAENVYLRAEVMGTHRQGEILGESEEIEKVKEQVEQIAGTDMTVLVLGETGTGKELVARLVHEKSARRERPLVKVNCSALPADLIESELFGHERGAFTGAVSKQVGRFELADRGTIFLDEIGELPLRLQSKLLRVLQEGEFERLGSGKTIKVDVRVIAATNRNLSEVVRRGRFRSDLYYRLNVYPIEVPPLRERGQDIGVLAEVFLQEAGRRLGKSFGKIPGEVIEALRHYDWPGNVRELENVIGRAAVTSKDSKLRLPDGWNHAPAAGLFPTAPSLGAPAKNEARTANGVSPLTLEQFERMRILEVLQQTNWRIEGAKGAALILGLHPNTLRSRIRKLAIERRISINP